MTSFEQLKALGPSVIRTVTSWLIAKAIVLATVTLGWAWAEQVLASDGVRVVVETAVAMGWYAGFRWLETQKDARWGWLLGLPGAPVYVKPEAPDPAPEPYAGEPLDDFEAHDGNGVEDYPAIVRHDP